MTIGLNQYYTSQSPAQLRVALSEDIPALLPGQTDAEKAAAVTPVNLQYAIGNILRYGTNTTPGTTDLTAALQAAANQQAFGGAPIYAPAGHYLFSGTITPSANGPFVMYGDGIGKTLLSYSGSGNWLNLTETGSASNLVQMHDFEIAPTGAANFLFNINGGSNIPSLTLYDIYVSITGTASAAAIFRLNNCGEVFAERLFFFSSSSATLAANTNGFSVVSSVAAVVYKFNAVSTYSIPLPFNFVGTSSPALEGQQFNMCDLVNCVDGVTSSSSGYTQPQFTWVGGHINATGRAIVCTGLTQVNISAGLFYNQGTQTHLSLTNCAALNINNNIFQQVGVNSADGIELGYNTAATGGVIQGNIFYMGTTGVAVNLFCGTSPNNLTQLSIQNNRRVSGGSATVAVASGNLDPTVVSVGNYPESAQNQTPTAVSTGSTISSAFACQPCTVAAAATGVILSVGTFAGQVCEVINESAANSITFAAFATSHVAAGAALVIAAQGKYRFTWNTVTGFWY